MIIQKTIRFKVNSKDLKYYQKLGYDIRSCIEIEIPVNDLQKCSSRKIFVKCDICGNEKLLPYRIYNQNINKTGIYCCCENCANKKRENTNIEKYGKKYQIETENFKIKSKNSKIEKYGDENFTNREKYKETCKKTYNCINTFQLETVKDKLKKTKLQKYGNENFTNSNKRKQTNLKKYGVEYYNNHEKYKKTCIEKYGVDSTFKLLYDRHGNKINNVIKEWFKNNPNEIEKRRCWMGSDEFKQKSIETCLKKYGVERNMHVDEIVLKNQIAGFLLKKYKDTDLYYRGTYELDFLNKYYNKINIKNAKSIPYIYENKKRRYFPDFYIENLNLLVEIKSSYTFSKFLELNLEKQKESIKQGFKHIFIIDKNYIEFENFL